MKKKVLCSLLSSIMLATMVLGLTACSKDSDSEEPNKEITTTYVLRDNYYSLGYATPDFTQKEGENNYDFKYSTKLVDEKNNKYEFKLIEGYSAKDSKRTWVTDSKFNFTIAWNDTTKEFIITDGYFKGGKFEVVDFSYGDFDSNTIKKRIYEFVIHYNGLEVVLTALDYAK